MDIPLENPELETVVQTQDYLEEPYHVVVLNDPVNLMTYVVMVFQKVFGMVKSTAEKHMMEVHERGRSVVWTGGREKAENFVHILQKWQLTAVLEKDD
jgi:ATP-dependent Clp protease adaptor protein ClpS